VIAAPALTISGSDQRDNNAPMAGVRIAMLLLTDRYPVTCGGGTAFYKNVLNRM